MIPTLHICGWNDTFENADTRKRERLKYFHAPSGCDSRGYLNLVSRFPQVEAMMAFGIFQALCQLSATLGRSVRGSFKNSDGSPMDLQQLSCLLRIEKCHLSAALEILCDEKVKWCKWTEGADDLPPICHPHPAFVQGEGKGKGEGKDIPLPPKGDRQGALIDPSEASPKPPKERVLPENYQRLSATAQKQTRVLRNSALMATIGRFLGRKPDTLWSVAEAVALKNINPSADEVALLAIYYGAVFPDPDKDYRRRDLLTLLNNWSGELDRARIFKANQ